MGYDSAVGMHNPTTMEPAIRRDEDTAEYEGPDL